MVGIVMGQKQQVQVELSVGKQGPGRLLPGFLRVAAAAVDQDILPIHLQQHALPLADIQNGSFAKRFMDDQAAGAPEFKRLRAEGEAHPIEKTGREVRAMFAWRSDVDKDYTEGSVAR